MESLKRPSIALLDEILGQKFNVLDDGFIRVVDYMGSDQAIVQAARVSYGEGTKQVNEDKGLIRYLMRNDHTTPFEMCEIKFHIRVPMDCWRQWIRHRTANVNEYSTRYSIAIDSAQTTPPDKWRKQSISNKQGSHDYINVEDGNILSEEEKLIQEQLHDIYKKRIEAGVAREQARKDLPLSTYTEAYWKIDLHNLFHFLRLRIDSHAQYEIRCYAEIIGYEIVKKWCPIAWAAFEDYKLNSLILTKNERVILSLIIGNDTNENIKNELIRLSFVSNTGKTTREFKEFEEKLKALKINFSLDLF
jgi:thymidylate synthase (FAD)